MTEKQIDGFFADNEIVKNDILIMADSGRGCYIQSVTKKVVKDYTREELEKFAEDDQKEERRERKKEIESCIETTETVSDLELI